MSAAGSNKRRIDSIDDDATQAAAASSAAKRVPDGEALTAQLLLHIDMQTADPLIDDKDGHVHVELGKNITKRYKSLRKLGEGTFGRVLECWDRMTREKVAVKIVRSVPKYRDAARYEIRVLERIKENDPQGKYHCVHLVEHFDYFNHICMVFKLYGSSLYDFMKLNQFQPFSMPQLQHIAFQLIEAVAFLHRIGITHTDLKPENILLVNSEPIRLQRKSSEQIRLEPRDSSIVLIDFGSAVMNGDHHPPLICTRHYRAPEITLCCDWDNTVDLWSIGCIIVELYCGATLFQTHDNSEHLAMIEKVLGKPLSPELCRRARDTNKVLGRDLRLRWPPKPANAANIKSKEVVASTPTLQEIISVRHPLLLKLCESLLQINPSDRLAAADALHSAFLAADLSNEDRRPPRNAFPTDKRRR